MSNFVNLLDIIYPVDSIYITFSETSPTDIVGGTWTPIIDEFLYSSSKYGVGNTGGSTEHCHVLSNHGGAQIEHTREGNWLNVMYNYTSEVQFSNPAMVQSAIQGVASNTASPQLSTYSAVALKGRTDDNGTYLPPFICVRMYRRTA